LVLGDLRFSEPGVSVFLPRSKEDQVGEGALVHIGRNPLSAHCPVAALKSWLEVSGIRTGWVFRRITRTGRIGADRLSPEAVRLILRERAWEAGYRDGHITPHSLRAGCITALARAAVHEQDIMQHSRHASHSAMRGYIRAALSEDAFKSRALWRLP
jgi:integrase